MAQYCPHCKWYSADGLTHCSTCGAPFEPDPEDDSDGAAVEERPLLERVGWAVALAAGVVVGGMALYGRYATPQNVGAAGAAADRAASEVRAALLAVYRWLIGPNGEYQDFVVIVLLGSAFVWLALWLAARFGRR